MPLKIGDPIPAPPPLRTEFEVMRTWTSTDTPVVSICCATYNHAAFITDALRGFLAQITTFPFEIIVRDDASTDGTTEIVRQFADIYPTIVRPIYEPTNTFSKGIRPSSVLYNHVRGSLLAFCEGDDYWIDPQKLQIQHDLLAKRAEASCSFHEVIHFDHAGRVMKLGHAHCPRRDHTPNEMMAGHCYAHPSTRMIRRLPADVLCPPEARHVLNGDVLRYSILGQYGIAAYAGDIVPSAYRQHSAGIWAPTSAASRTITHATSYYWIAEYYARLGNRNDIVLAWRKRCIRTTLSRSTLSEKCVLAASLLLDRLRGTPC